MARGACSGGGRGQEFGGNLPLQPRVLELIYLSQTGSHFGNKLVSLSDSCDLMMSVGPWAPAGTSKRGQLPSPGKCTG